MGKAEEYDDTNLWHSHFFVMLSVRCSGCDQLAKTDDLWLSRLKQWRRDDALARYCVLATERLQKQGWRMLDQYNFICPECWSQRKAS